jgi:tetratricopeptide (TPR) repeat protein
MFAWLGVQRAALYADPEALISQDIESWPRSDRSYVNLGIVLEMQEDYEGAARQYELAMGRRETANWRPIVALARLKLRAGDFDDAVALSADAFRHVFSVPGSPDLPSLVNTVVSSFRIAGRVEAALPLLRAAAATGEHSSLLEESVLIVSAEAKGLSEAKEEFLQAAESNPLARLNLAIALAREGNNEEAVALLDRMIEEAPAGSDPLRIADVYALKGAMSTNDPTAARASFEEVLRLNPSHAEALNNFAWLLATSTGEAVYDPPRALELARKAVRLRPFETNFQGTLAVALAAAGFGKEAEAVLSEAQRFGRINGNSNPQLPDLVREARDRAAHASALNGSTSVASRAKRSASFRSSSFAITPVS